MADCDGVRSDAVRVGVSAGVAVDVGLRTAVRLGVCVAGLVPVRVWMAVGDGDAVGVGLTPGDTG